MKKPFSILSKIQVLNGHTWNISCFSKLIRTFRVTHKDTLLMLTILGAAAVFVTGCDHHSSTKAEVEIVFTTAFDSSSRTAVPDVDMEIGHYNFTATGPGAESIVETLSQNQLYLELNPGEWQFSVTGYNQYEQAVIQGSTFANLFPGEQITIYMYLFPLDGEGAMELIIELPDGIPAESHIIGSLTPLSDPANSENLSFPVHPATHLFEELSAGYYTLSILINYQEQKIAGLTRVLRVISGHITQVTTEFVLTPAKADIIIHPDLKQPLPVSISKIPSVIGRGYPILASTPNYEPELTTIWYINGSPFDTGESTYIDTEYLLGNSRVDLTMHTIDGSRAGSASATFELAPKILLGNYQYYTTFFHNPPFVEGLRGPRWVTTGESYILVSGYDSNGVSIFLRSQDSNNPTPQFIQSIRGLAWGNLQGALGTAFTKDEDGFIAAGYSDNSINYYSLVQNEVALISTLTDSDDIIGIQGAYDTLVVGDYLYVSGFQSNAIAVFHIAPHGLGHIQTLRGDSIEDDLYGIMEGPKNMAVSPNQQQIAVSAWNSDSVVIFNRNQDTGFLSFSQALPDDEDIGMYELRTPEGIVLTENHLYVGTYFGNGITHFSRTEEEYEFIKEYINGDITEEEIEISGLFRVRDIALTPNGEKLYTISSGDNALGLFQRNTETGALIFVDTLFYEQDHIPGFDRPRNMGITNDGEELYIAASGDDGLTLFLQPPD